MGNCVYSTLPMCRHTKRSVVCFVPALLACRPLSPVRFPHETGSCQRWAIPRPAPDGCVPAAGCRRCVHGRCRCHCPPGAVGLTTRTQGTTPLPWGAAERRQGTARQEARPPAVPHGARAIIGDERGAERHRPAAWPEGARVPSHRTAAAHRHPQPAPSSGKRRQSEGTARPCIIRIVPSVNSWYTCSRHKDASLW